MTFCSSEQDDCAPVVSTTSSLATPCLARRSSFSLLVQHREQHVYRRVLSSDLHSTLASWLFEYAFRVIASSWPGAVPPFVSTFPQNQSSRLGSLLGSPCGMIYHCLLSGDCSRYCILLNKGKVTIRTRTIELFPTRNLLRNFDSHE